MITGQKPYPAYKQTNVLWLDRVPQHWALLRGRRLFRCIDVRSRAGDEELLTVSSERGVVPRVSAAVTMFKAESYVGYKLCWPGDLVINSLWAWGGGLGVSRHHGIVSSAYGVYRLRHPYDEHPRYVDRLVRSAPFNYELHLRSKGIWISRLQLTDEAFLQATFPVPPPTEQAAIARFLDHTDRRIRRYIRAKQKLIALLEEQKQAIIHQAVTGEIDVGTGQPYPAYKPSGVQWLGEVPAHWELRSLKWVAGRSQTGTTPPTSDAYHYENGTVPWYGPSSCGVFEHVGQPVRHLRESAFVTGGARRILGPAVLVIVIGATVGRMALMPNDGSTNQQITAFEFSTDLVSPLFILCQLRRSESWLKSTASTATIPILDSDVLARLPCAIPPIVEQEMISNYLNLHISQIRHAAAEQDKNMALVREYRTRLIADVVTGKLDVREAAAGLPEVDPLAGEDDADDGSNPEPPLSDGDEVGVTGQEVEA